MPRHKATFRAKVSETETNALCVMAKARWCRYGRKASAEFESIMDELQSRMPDTTFVEFCDAVAEG